MSWPGRVRRDTSEASKAAALDDPAAAPVERSSPGLAALFDALTQDGRHSVLDLGLAGDRHLGVLSRFARQIRFAGFIPHPPEGDAWTSALEALPPNACRPYDVVLAWDILDRIDPPQRAGLVERLVALTAPDARLYAVVDASGAATTRPLRSTLTGVNRVSVLPVGPPKPARTPLLPAPLERVLAPFAVTQAFTLRTGLREYVAVKRS